jgi:hypothetical protein
MRATILTHELFSFLFHIIINKTLSVLQEVAVGDKVTAGEEAKETKK